MPGKGISFFSVVLQLGSWLVIPQGVNRQEIYKFKKRCNFYKKKY